MQVALELPPARQLLGIQKSGGAARKLVLGTWNPGSALILETLSFGPVFSKEERGFIF